MFRTVNPEPPSLPQTMFAVEKQGAKVKSQSFAAKSGWTPGKCRISPVNRLPSVGCQPVKSDRHTHPTLSQKNGFCVLHFTNRGKDRFFWSGSRRPVPGSWSHSYSLYFWRNKVFAYPAPLGTLLLKFTFVVLNNPLKITWMYSWVIYPYLVLC